MITEELLELQQQANEYQNLLYDHMLKSAPNIEQCVSCKEYYSRLTLHVCPVRRGSNEKPTTKSTSIRYRDGRVRFIEYVLIDLPVYWERCRRFRRAWGCW
jgi:hypothetical protein